MDHQVKRSRQQRAKDRSRKSRGAVCTAGSDPRFSDTQRARVPDSRRPRVSGHRSGFDQLLALIKARQVDVLIRHDRARLRRTPGDIRKFHGEVRRARLRRNVGEHFSDLTERLNSRPRAEGALCQGLMTCRVHDSRFQVKYSERIGPRLKRVASYECRPAGGNPHAGGSCEIPAAFVDPVIEAAFLKGMQAPSPDNIQGLSPKKRHGRQARRPTRRAQVQHAQEKVKEQLQQLHALLGDLPRLWRHPSVTARQRKAVIWTVIKAIRVTPSVREWTLEIEWITGTQTRHQFLTPHGTRELITRAFREGHSGREIADLLNASAAEIGPPVLLTASRSARATLRKLRPVLRQLQAQHAAATASADGASEATSG